jgi:hypothetical protein
MAAKRGQCDTCGYRYPLRRDGTMQTHHGYYGQERAPGCEGSGKPPRPFDPNDCGECMEHRFATPGLAEACASMSIETRKTGEALMWDYLVGFHENGHQEVA